MIALGKIFQDLLAGGIDKVATLGADAWAVCGTFGTGALEAIKTFISG